MSADEDNDLRHRLAALEDEVQSLRNNDGAKSTRRMMLKGGVAALGLGALATPSSAGTNQVGSIGGENATLDLWTEDLYIVEQGSTPSAPPSGYIDIYAKTDGNFYKLESDGTESQLGGGGLSAGEDFDGQGTSDFTNLASVSTDELDGVADHIFTDEPLSEINSILSNPGTYIFAGTHTITADITPTADCRIIVAHGATVKFEDSGLTSEGWLFNANNVSIDLIVHGTLDPNVENQSYDASCARFDGGERQTIHVDGTIGETSAGFGLFNTSASGFIDPDIESHYSSLLSVNGCDGVRFEKVYGYSANFGEVVDLNGDNENVYIGHVHGKGYQHHVVGVDESRNVNIGSIRADADPDLTTIPDTNPESYIRITGDNGGSLGESKDIQIGYLSGPVNGHGVQLFGVGSTNPITNITISDGHINAGTHGLLAVADDPDVFDSISLTGTIDADQRGIYADQNGNQQGSIYINVEIQSASTNGVHLLGFRTVTGSVVAHALSVSNADVRVEAPSGTTVTTVALDTQLVGGSGDGLLVDGGGTVNECKIEGRIAGNDTDIDLQTGSMKFDGFRGSVNDPNTNLLESDYS
jgi:hypothetical protein